MKIKMIALDMDGTVLLDDYQSISKRSKETIEAAINKGIEIVPATGRARGQIPQSITAIEGIQYAVISNGATVIDLKSNRVIASNYIGAGTVKKIAAILRKKNLFYEIYYQGQSYIQQDLFDQIENIDRFDPGHVEFIKRECQRVDSVFDLAMTHATEIEKINIAFLPDQLYDLAWQKFSRYKGIFLTMPIPNVIEITHRKTNKGQGLKQLCEDLKISPNELMVIGDSDNDIHMFEYAGFPVAVANATPELKALAKAQTLSYLDDGVAHAIEKYVL